MASLEAANKAIARRFVEEVLSTGDVDAARALYADDFEVWTAGSLPFGKSPSTEDMPWSACALFEARGCLWPPGRCRSR